MEFRLTASNRQTGRLWIYTPRNAGISIADAGVCPLGIFFFERLVNGGRFFGAVDIKGAIGKNDARLAPCPAALAPDRVAPARVHV
jgi:hypothetical protein